MVMDGVVMLMDGDGHVMVMVMRMLARFFFAVSVDAAVFASPSESVGHVLGLQCGVWAGDMSGTEGYVGPLSSGISFRALPRATFKEVIRACRRAESKAAGLPGTHTRERRILFDLSQTIRTLLTPAAESAAAASAAASSSAARLAQWEALLNLSSGRYTSREARTIARWIAAARASVDQPSGSHAVLSLSPSPAVGGSGEMDEVEVVGRVLAGAAQEVAMLRAGAEKMRDAMGDMQEEMGALLAARQREAEGALRRAKAEAEAGAAARVHEVARQLEAATREIGMLRGQTKDAEQYIATLERESAAQVERLVQLQSQSTERAGRVAGLEKAVADANAKLARMEEENAGLRSALAAYEGIVCDVEAELTTTTTTTVPSFVHPAPSSVGASVDVSLGVDTTRSGITHPRPSPPREVSHHSGVVTYQPRKDRMLEVEDLDSLLESSRVLRESSGGRTPPRSSVVVSPLRPSVSPRPAASGVMAILKRLEASDRRRKEQSTATPAAEPARSARSVGSPTRQVSPRQKEAQTLAERWAAKAMDEYDADMESEDGEGGRRGRRRGRGGADQEVPVYRDVAEALGVSLPPPRSPPSSRNQRPRSIEVPGHPLWPFD